MFNQGLSQDYEHLQILLDTYKNWVKKPRQLQPHVNQSVDQDALDKGVTLTKAGCH